MNKEFINELNQVKKQLLTQLKEEIKVEMIKSSKQASSPLDTTNDMLSSLPIPPPPPSNDQDEESVNSNELVEEEAPTNRPLIGKSNLNDVAFEQQLNDDNYNWNRSEWDEPKQEYYAFNHPYQPNDTYEDSEYFQSYSRVGIHNEMVFDKRRTASYYNAIMGSKELFKDKVVMDVGCGTGLLSCFCAMAGAKRVYAVEAGDMAYNAELIVNQNNLQNVVTVMKGKVEHIAFPEYVDIIVSEWIGAFLIFESMLESVIYARDNLLKPDGLLFPSKACLYLAPIRVPEFFQEKFDCWNNVYGLDMSPLIPFAQQEILPKSIRDYYIKEEHVIAPPKVIRYLDLNTITIQQLSRTVLNFKFDLPEGDFHGYGTWFSYWFEGLDKGNGKTYYGIDANGELFEQAASANTLTPCPFEITSNTLELSTAPGAGSTHWRQVLFLFENPKSLVLKSQNNNNNSTSIEAKGIMRVTQHLSYRRHWWVEFTTSVASQTKSHTYQNFLI